MSAAMLNVRGIVQREGEVIHVIADRLEDLTPMLGTIGDMPFPHRHAPSDAAKGGGGSDPRERRPAKSPPHSAARSAAGIKLKSRNFH